MTRASKKWEKRGKKKKENGNENGKKWELRQRKMGKLSKKLVEIGKKWKPKLSKCKV